MSHNNLEFVYIVESVLKNANMHINRKNVEEATLQVVDDSSVWYD